MRLLACLIVLMASLAPEPAIGECEGKGWRGYEAGQLPVQVRTCSDRGISQVDVRNPHSYRICVTVVAENADRRWPNWPVEPGETLNKMVERDPEIWRIGAHPMRGVSCER